MLYVKTLKSVPYLDPDWLEESAEVKVVCINDGYQHQVSKLALAAFSPTFLEALLGTGIATSHLLCGPGAGEGGGWGQEKDRKRWEQGSKGERLRCGVEGL